jgi:hypothetical protein
MLHWSKGYLMSDVLARLKAAAAKNSQAAAQAPAAVEAAPVTSTPAPTPAAAAPQAQTAPQSAPEATKAVSTAVSATAAPATQDEAKNTLALLWGKTTDQVEASDVFDEVNGQGGVAFSQPFAQIKKGNWDVYSKTPSEIMEFMPVANRPYTMVYLGYSVGATVWPISSNPNGKPDGKPPLYRFRIPSSRTYPGSTDLIRRTLGIGSKVQYKKIKPETLKTAGPGIGKLVPEIHIHGWTPKTGFIILSVPGFKSAELTAASLAQDTARDFIGVAPLVFILDKHQTVNKKAAPGADNATWDDHFVRAEARPNETKTTDYMAAWEAWSSANVIELATRAQAFASGSDFSGVDVETVERYLSKFEMLPVG